MNSNHVLISIPVLLLGGTEIQTLNLVRVLIDGRYDVTVCCYYEYDESVVDWFREAGARVILLGLDRSDWHFGVGRILKLVRRLIAIFREVHPDIVHIQYIAPGLVPIIAARLAGMETVFVTVHNAGNIAYGRKAKILLQIAARLSTTFFCVSRGVEEFWFGSSTVFDSNTTFPKQKHFTIYNPIDTTMIANVSDGVTRRKLRASLRIDKRLVVGIVGRLMEQKGHIVLLKAMVHLIKDLPNVILMVIGEGTERVKLEKEANRLGLTAHIYWLGAKQPETVFEMYSVMEVFVMPSLFEGFGLTAGEAMAAGLPVVGTNIIGLREVIENDVTGVLVSPGDSTALAKAVTDLLKNPDRAREMGAKGRERIKRVFSMERFAEATLSAYSLLAKVRCHL